MTRTEVQAFADFLEGRGAYLRFVTPDFRRGAIVGTIGSLETVPTAPVNDGSFIHIRDEIRGGETQGMALIAVGGTVTVVGSGTIVSALGLGLVGAGLFMVMYYARRDMKSPPPAEKPSSDNSDTPNDLGDLYAPEENIELPNAVAVGEPENGINTDTLLASLGRSSVDIIINDIPIGWDEDTGGPTTGLGGGPIGDGGDSGDDGGFSLDFPLW